MYLDSGALYRAVTLYAIENQLISKDGEIDVEGLSKALLTLDVHFGLNGKTYVGPRCVEREIRTLKVANKVSPISTVAQVRAYVDNRLRELAKDRGVVMDGRDIGTTVFPDAEIKIFMVADPVVRAERRAAEMRAKGEVVDIQAVMKNLQERDYIDSHREVSPLTQAEDAVVLDNSNMTFEDQMEWFKALAAQRFGL